MFFKLIFAAAVVVGTLWLAGYDPARIKRNMLAWSQSSAGATMGGSSDWGPGT